MFSAPAFSTFFLLIWVVAWLFPWAFHFFEISVSICKLQCFLHAQPLLPPLICNNCLHISLFNFLLFYVVCLDQKCWKINTKTFFSVLVKIAFWDPLGPQKIRKVSPWVDFWVPLGGPNLQKKQKWIPLIDLDHFLFKPWLSWTPVSEKHRLLPPWTPIWGPSLVDVGSNFGQIW